MTCVPLTALAQDAQSGNGNWAPGDVNLQFSRAYVFVGKVGLGHEHAVEGRMRSGVVHLGAIQRAGHVEFDMTTFRADTDEARKYIGLEGTTGESMQSQVTANMRGPVVLDSGNHPTARFDIDSAVLLEQPSKRGLPLYRLDGKFILHGAARPLQIIAEAEPKDGWVHLVGNFAILQSQFGMTPFTKAFGAIGVTDRLQIWGDLWVVAPPALSGRPAETRR